MLSQSRRLQLSKIHRVLPSKIHNLLIRRTRKQVLSKSRKLKRGKRKTMIRHSYPLQKGMNQKQQVESFLSREASLLALLEL